MKDLTSLRCSDGVSPLKRVAAIHDISCFGRCALTVILPTLSAMGVQAVPLPTCLLSSHTGGFTDLYFEDLTPSMEKISDHFDRLDVKFDAIYTGFLGNDGQIERVRSFIDRFAAKDTFVAVDPVMGDDGELYSTYTPELMRGMARLCEGADIITPNLTEACFLTDTPYIDTAKMSAAELVAFGNELCDKLLALGAESVVLTGLRFGTDKLCVCGKRRDDKELFIHTFPRVDKSYPGTGDVFTSVLLGALLRGEDFEEAIIQACGFVSRAMKYSARFDYAEREGIAFEAFLGELTPPSPMLD